MAKKAQAAQASQKDNEEVTEETTAAGPGTKKKRTRKKREIYFDLAAVKDGQLVSDTVEVPDRGDRELAVKKFKDKYKMEPQRVQGPWYEVATGPTPAQARITVNVPAKDIEYTGERHMVHYKGWEAIAMGLKGAKTAEGNAFGDNEIFNLLFNKPLSTGEDKAPKPKFGGAPALLPKEELKFVAKL